MPNEIRFRNQINNIGEPRINIFMFNLLKWQPGRLVRMLLAYQDTLFLRDRADKNGTIIALKNGKKQPEIILKSAGRGYLCQSTGLKTKQSSGSGKLLPPEDY